MPYIEFVSSACATKYGRGWVVILKSLSSICHWFDLTICLYCLCSINLALIEGFSSNMAQNFISTTNPKLKVKVTIEGQGHCWEE